MVIEVQKRELKMVHAFFHNLNLNAKIRITINAILMLHVHVLTIFFSHIMITHVL